jgi:CHAT domain-containing protein
LSEAVVAPVLPLLKSERLILVADDVLQQAPFRALPLPGGAQSKPTPLLARFEILMAPSASFLAAMREVPESRAVPAKDALIFAAPAFRDPASELPLAADEAQQIAALLPPGKSSVFTGRRASVDTLRNATLSDYRVLHFVTHAVNDEERTDLSGIRLAETGAAGASGGLLRLFDIYRLNNVPRLVVLSACETATGKPVPGEGVIALSRGFLYAGARGVVATLWPVRDAASEQLMIALYSQLARTGRPDPPAALREAQLSMWRANLSPVKWGAFVLIGE